MTAHEKKARKNHCPACHADPGQACIRIDPEKQGKAHPQRHRFAGGTCECGDWSSSWFAR